MKRLIPRKDLDSFRLRLEEEGKSLVFTNGCFDLVHPGHLALLERASTLGDTLLVAINDDESVRRLKGPGRPFFPAEERAEILLAIRWVDYVTIFAEDTPLETIELLVPQVLVKGAEYEEEEIVGAGFVRARGGRVVRIDMQKGYSSSSLIEKIRLSRPSP